MRPWSGTLHWAVALSFGRGALRRALLDLHPPARRARQHRDAAVLRRPRRHASAWRPSRFGDWTWPSGAVSWAGVRAHRLLRLGRAPAADHRPPLRAGLDAGAVQLYPDRLDDGLELADLRAAAGRLDAGRRGIVVASGLYIWLRETQPRADAGATPACDPALPVEGAREIDPRGGRPNAGPQDRARDRREPGDRRRDRRRLRRGPGTRWCSPRATAAKLDATIAALGDGGAAASAVPCDVADPASVEALFARDRASGTGGSTSSSTTPAPTIPTTLAGDVSWEDWRAGAVGQPRRRLPGGAGRLPA